MNERRSINVNTRIMLFRSIFERDMRKRESLPDILIVWSIVIVELRPQISQDGIGLLYAPPICLFCPGEKK
jgi:hypothetical protein